MASVWFGLKSSSLPFCAEDSTFLLLPERSTERTHYPSRRAAGILRVWKAEDICGLFLEMEARRLPKCKVGLWTALVVWSSSSILASPFSIADVFNSADRADRIAVCSQRLAEERVQSPHQGSTEGEIWKSLSVVLHTPGGSFDVFFMLLELFEMAEGLEALHWESNASSSSNQWH